MRTNRKQGIFVLVIAALMVISSLSIPALAERMITAAEDKVQVEPAQTQPGDYALADEARAALEQRRTTVEQQGEVAEFASYTLGGEAMATLEQRGRQAFKDVLGIEIPEDYRPLDARAYDDDEDGIGYILSLMPNEWEASVDALAVPMEQPYYTAQFGDVNIETGEARLLGIQRFILGWDKTDTLEVEYSEGQIKGMEDEARAFATELGMDVQALIGTDKVLGGYPAGCVLTFSMAEGKTLSVTVSEQGEISGYSLVPGKG